MFKTAVLNCTIFTNNMNCNCLIVLAAGIIVSFAYDDISSKKVACQSHTSSGLGNDASRAVDGDTATCMKTLPIGRTSPYKTVWWKVDLGGVYNIYNINILFKNYDGFEDRQRGRFAGFSLYVSNTDVSTPTDIKASSLCYKDGILLPPLDFTTTCIKSGRYVIYYNERLDGVNYPQGYEVENIFTEICQINVTGCTNANLYGSYCDTTCPTNCKDSTCNILSGACSMCKPGWIGMYCNTKCVEGWYGVNCSHPCEGHCRDNTACDHVTGQCDGGCDAGWTGFPCDKECKDGTYGYNCVNKCNGNCMNDSPCNKQTGLCDKGCKPGYTNVDCSKGQYGINCRELCSGHCINNEPCDHVSGECRNGCQDGFNGTHCNNDCIQGFFGTNCSQECSPNCDPGTCRHTDGTCATCGAGWKGRNCTTECFESFGENCLYKCSPHCYNQICDRFNGRCLIGCQDGFYGEMCERGKAENISKQTDMSSSIIWAIGFSISMLLNLIFIGCGILLYRRIKSNRLSIFGSSLPCWKKSIYQDTFVKTDESSTYQELNISESAYQNTTIR